jgi:hypothetical protein
MLCCYSISEVQLTVRSSLPVLRHPAARRPGRVHLGVEQLEPRHLPSGGPTLDLASSIPLSWTGQPATAQAVLDGSIGSAAGLSADVNWYSFTLDRPAQVNLSANSTGGTVLGLYNSDGLADYYDPLGHRLLAQSQGSAGAGTTDLSRALGPGTYYVAVSGAGDAYFNPFLADSGYAGAAGSYQLTVSANDLSSGAALPSVLTADVSPDPAASGPLTRSPLEIYVDLSGPLDPSVSGNLDVELHCATNPGSPNLLAGYTYSPQADELQLQLNAPLGPDTYQLTVAANAGGVPALAQDYSYTFLVTGIEGTNGTGDGTAQTAQNLVLSNGFAQLTGAIGDNPAAGFFDPNNVDAYHFQITQPGNYALVAEAFAGRIGSPLDPALTLYQVENGMLHLVAFNDNTSNNTLASPGIHAIDL